MQVHGPVTPAYSRATGKMPEPQRPCQFPAWQSADLMERFWRPRSVQVPGLTNYPRSMVGRSHREFLATIRDAAGDADRDGTAALNGLVLAGALMVTSSVTLVSVGGPEGVLLWALIWAIAAGGVAVWLAPHLRRVRSWNIEQAEHRRAFLDIARQRAVDLLLRDDTPERERRAAAALLNESNHARDA
jgi:hypothetical protein